MEIWFLQNRKRLLQEKEAIRSLEESAEWLKGLNWVLDNGSLCIDAIIEVSESEYEIRLTYPALFPSIPPSVRPKDPKERWSTHQYQGGSLCLEWGPDNWHPDLTGKDILESAYKLLSIENPRASDERREIAPSRHKLSMGQELHGKYGRFLFGNELETYLQKLPAISKGTIEFSIQWQSKSLLAFIQKVNPSTETIEPWENLSIPAGIRATAEKRETGFFYKTKLNPETIKKISSIEEIKNLLTEIEADTGSIEPTQNFLGILLLDASDSPHFFLLWHSKDEKENHTCHLAPIIQSKDSIQSRIPDNLQALKEKSVGIVGLGSVGSRLAVSLARMGVSSFFLVDDDIILPQNICRHILDWRNIGEHKVDAISEVLYRISPNIKVEVTHLNFTGQESTTALSHMLNKLGRKDLLIETTADSKVFNLMAAVAQRNNKPLLWAKVYDGGIGGLIARSRPNQDPDPHTMRAAYYHYLSDAPEPDLKTVGDYAGEDSAQNIISASDADVGVIAYHAAQLAIDTLLGNNPPVFPYSMYLIGIQKSWIFEQPFDTIPIVTGNLAANESPDDLKSEEMEDYKEFLVNLLKEKLNESSTAQ